MSYSIIAALIILSLLVPFAVGFGGLHKIERPVDIEYWYGEEWLDYDDQLEVIWKYETWPLYLREARIQDLSTLPGMSYDRAFEILQNRQSALTTDTTKISSCITMPEFRENLSKGELSNTHTPHFEFRTHAQVQPPLAGTIEETERFAGSALGMTQKYYVRYNQFSCGANLDKDRYEPKLNDLDRYWVAWQGSQTDVIIGDFHVTTGQGLGLWTQPAYYERYDAPGSYRRSGRGLIPATDNTENSALRGIGICQRVKKFKLTIFASETNLDAILDDSSEYALYLSNTGLHRTSEEREKEDAIREHCSGGVLSYVLSPSLQSELVFELSGYLSQYSHIFNPEPEPRCRLPMSGRYSGAGSANVAFSSPAYAAFCEAALDLDSNIAWLFGLGTSADSSGQFNADLLVQHYPVQFSNPRAIPPSSSSSQYGRTSSAFLLRGKPSAGILSNWRGHVEIDILPWRSYYIPVPSTKSRASLETTFRSAWDSEIIIRYRRKTFESATSEEDPVLPVTENRVRIISDYSPEVFLLKNFSLWVEGVQQRIHYSPVRYSEIQQDMYEIPTQYGCMAGIRFSVQFGETYRALGSINYSGSITGFKTDPGSVKMYIGDGSLPDRINSVQLSGTGFRWASSISWRRGSRNWLTFKAARTIKTNDGIVPGNLEMYISLSYLFRSSN